MNDKRKKEESIEDQDFRYLYICALMIFISLLAAPIVERMINPEKFEKIEQQRIERKNMHENCMTIESKRTGFSTNWSLESFCDKQIRNDKVNEEYK